MNWGLEQNNRVDRIVASYLETVNKKAVFFKQQGWCMEDLFTNIVKKASMKAFFYEYTTDGVKEAYEPFLSWIRQAYYVDYSEKCSVEEFVENCGVYSLQREVFCSYITSGVCERKMEVMMNEYEYEEERLLESIYSSLCYIAGEKILVLGIGKLHLASESSLRFINRVLEREDQIRFVFTYGEMFQVREYCQSQWVCLMQKAEENKLIFSMEYSDTVQNFDFPAQFVWQESKIQDYLISINNMVQFFAFRDADYYLNEIIHSVFRMDSVVSDENRFRILELMGRVYLGMGNYKDALLICEKMVPLFREGCVLYREYTYHYFSAKAHLLMGETDLTRKCCSRGHIVAEKIGDELQVMNIEVIESVAEFGSLKDLFRCNYSYQVKEKVMERAKKFGYENFLAYMYVFGYDNDDESIHQIGRGIKEPKYFNQGIAIAEKLDNKNLMLNAYMKNIIRYSDYGFYQYVREMYEKRLLIIDKSKPIRMAHTYGGLGYNAIVLEDYGKADRYLRIALEILIEHKKAEDVAEILYNMFINYYVAGSNEKVISCIELLIKVMECIHIQGLRICNTSKIYGMLALAYYKLGRFFDCYYCMDYMERVLSYVINKQDEKVEELWIEDLFLYHLCKANLFSYENNLEKAKEHFAYAEKYMKKHDGIKFYAYPDYAMFYSRFLKKIGEEGERIAFLREMISYCQTHGYPGKAAWLQAELDNVPFQKEIKYALPVLPEKDILDICGYAGTKTELKKREKDIEFLTLCHTIMGKEEGQIADVVEHTMSLIRNTFSLDRAYFIEKRDACYSITYASEAIELSIDEMEELFGFFDFHKVEFACNRLEQGYPRYLSVTEKVGGEEVAEILGIPVYNSGNLIRIFIATIDVHRSFTTNRKWLEQSDLGVIKCAISQLDEAIARIQSNLVIRNMNAELEKTAITDQLTGLYNRVGWNKIIGEMVTDPGVVIYMDVDNFKVYNDTYGHNAGDAILKGFADILRSNLGSNGYAIRYGGDEFVIVLPKKDEAFAKRIVGDIQSQLREEKSIQAVIGEQTLTSSAGIAKYESSDQTSIEEALKLADKALYYVKNHEKGEVAYWSEIARFENKI